MADDAQVRTALPYGTISGAWNPYFPSPPTEPSFVISGHYVTPKRGDEQVSRYVPLLFDEVRSDVRRLVDVKVSRVAIEKVGPLYRGVIDSGGKPFLFSMSGDGIFTEPVPVSKRSQLWRAFDRLLDREYRQSVERMRKR